mmetsp:Transcript_44087/g.96226  ORF Transcript_44087/g.96226 Transcript_44087/m.96226 type:complete len:239 (+) Transcript_44087:950-1666(+)
MELEEAAAEQVGPLGAPRVADARHGGGLRWVDRALALRLLAIFLGVGVGALVLREHVGCQRRRGARVLPVELQQAAAEQVRLRRLLQQLRRRRARRAQILHLSWLGLWGRTRIADSKVAELLLAEADGSVQALVDAVLEVLKVLERTKLHYALARKVAQTSQRDEPVVQLLVRALVHVDGQIRSLGNLRFRLGLAPPCSGLNRACSKTLLKLGGAVGAPAGFRSHAAAAILGSGADRR